MKHLTIRPLFQKFGIVIMRTRDWKWACDQYDDMCETIRKTRIVSWEAYNRNYAAHRELLRCLDYLDENSVENT